MNKSIFQCTLFCLCLSAVLCFGAIASASEMSETKSPETDIVGTGEAETVATETEPEETVLEPETVTEPTELQKRLAKPIYTEIDFDQYAPAKDENLYEIDVTDHFTFFSPYRSALTREQYEKLILAFKPGMSYSEIVGIIGKANTLSIAGPWLPTWRMYDGTLLRIYFMNERDDNSGWCTGIGTSNIQIVSDAELVHFRLEYSERTDLIVKGGPDYDKRFVDITAEKNAIMAARAEEDASAS